MTRPGISRLGALRIADNARWANEIRSAMRAAAGRVPAAAEALGVSARQLFRFLADDALADIPRAPAGRTRIDPSEGSA